MQGGRLGVFSSLAHLLEDVQVLRPTVFAAPPTFWNGLFNDFQNELMRGGNDSNSNVRHRWTKSVDSSRFFGVCFFCQSNEKTSCRLMFSDRILTSWFAWSILNQDQKDAREQHDIASLHRKHNSGISWMLGDDVSCWEIVLQPWFPPEQHCNILFSGG